MRIAPLLVAALLVVARPAPAADDADADVVVRKWLVLPAVDKSLRRTLRPDAVFAKHLLDRASPPPKEGDEVTGTLGVAEKWIAREAITGGKEDGVVPTNGIGWAYASVESAADRVVIAKLEGAALLFVSAAGFTGDMYELGDAGVPVALRKGANDVYVAGVRDGFRLELIRAGRKRSRYEAFGRVTLPNADPGGEALGPGSYEVLNDTADPLSLEGREIPLVPLGIGRRGLDMPRRSEAKDGIAFVLGHDHVAPVNDRKPGEPYRRTFVSQIDGSVQSYALLPPSKSDLDKSKTGLVLSLHGAGVECMDQAKAYAPKPDFWVVCPTNRGRYGFDWQDWGRLDAYEVLEDALKVTGVDPRRVYLTGHSMGGHGTWHLAANDPGRFLAIAPSAGWSSFENLNGPQTTPLAWMWRAADGASQTLDLVGNLAQIPTYVLHGEKDDNVPLSEAQLMVGAITKAGGKPEFHVEPGVGHWWDKYAGTGADCVDWPGIWELFRKTQPKRMQAAPTEVVSFTSMDTSVASNCDWLSIWQPLEYARPSHVKARLEGERVVVVSTENVREFTIDVLRRRSDVDHFVESYDVSIDGIREPSCKILDFQRDERWRWVLYYEGHGPKQKYAGHSGPFKRAFTNRFVLVYGTAGDAAENRELLEKARYDSEVWAYRANGDANLMSDAQFLAGDFKDRNVIVYGNADTNSAWKAVFDDDCPVQAKRGVMTVNGTKHEGVVAAAFVRPRKGSDAALAAAFADTGAAATRMFYAFPVFSSGVGIPDYVVFGPGFLREWDGDVRAAGWFDSAWRMK